LKLYYYKKFGGGVMTKIVSIEEAISHIKDGMTIMVGGFLGSGSPHKIIDALVKKEVKDLTLICNDTAFPDLGVGKMVVGKQFKKVIVSHIGTNQETGRQMNAGETEVVLVPQGTLVEQIRAAGAGLGGFLTPTGVGTLVEEGKQKIEIDGKTYLLELPVKADIAIIFGNKVDKKGNVYYEGAARNFNIVMSMAADTVIIEGETIVDVGQIAPQEVVIPSIFIDYIVRGEK